MSILAFTLGLLACARAQGDLTEANNVTELEGTWSSNAAISTGGVSWSFVIECDLCGTVAFECLEKGMGNYGCWNGHGFPCHRATVGDRICIARLGSIAEAAGSVLQNADDCRTFVFRQK